MGLAVLADRLAVGADEEGRVEVDARPLLLEDRGADRRAVLAGLLAHRRDGVAALVLGAVDVRVVAVLEDVLVVEELRQDDQVGRLARDVVDVPARLRDVLVAGVLLALHLDEGQPQRAHRASGGGGRTGRPGSGRPVFGYVRAARRSLNGARLMY
jgi:hypothetical protein